MMKFIFGLQRNIEIFDNLILFFWVCIARNAQSTQNKLAYLCNISRKTCGMKLFFCLQVNTKVFYKVLAQSTKINKFAISLQYLKENRKNEVNFLLADKLKDFFRLIISF